MTKTEDIFNISERNWKIFSSSIKRTREQLENYVYDPLDSPIDEYYDYYGPWKHECDNLFFLLPRNFRTHSIDQLLLPLPPKQIPAPSAPPPLRPDSDPNSYSARLYKARIKVDYLFNNRRWSEKAKEILSHEDFNNRIVSREDRHVIDNLIMEEDYVNLISEMNSIKFKNSQIFENSSNNLNELRKSLNLNQSVEDNVKLMILSHQRHYLPSFLRKNFTVNIDAELKTMLIQFEFPDYSSRQISCGKFQNGRRKYLSATQKRKLVRTCLYSLIIRAGYLASIANLFGIYENIVINVEQNWFDGATGQPRNGIIASAQASSSYFRELDLSKLDPALCFKGLKGISTSSLENVSSIRPIIMINKDDERFIQSKNLSDELYPDLNLATIDWEDFEHIVAQLFEWEFGKIGVEVKVTRASRDRGVDAVIFDSDPLRGGKYVLQAKRYTRTVDVSSVRDLYGTVLNEGANRGILITTSGFGPDAYEFAKDKPISLVDGSNLLLMFQRHGRTFRIDLEEARSINNLNS